jgi:predicted PurR-regulated permease PerM
MRLAAPVLDPILFAVILSLLFGPIYARLKRRGIPTPLALVIMLVGLPLLFLVSFYVLSVSIARFSGEVGSYATELNEQLASIEVLVDRVGLSNVDVRNVVKPSALVAGAVGVVPAVIAGFLLNLFLIPMIMLFLLAEGPALMSRVRASAGRDHPQVERLTVVGRSVVRQFNLRATVNLVTAAGVTVLLFMLGGRLSSTAGDIDVLPELRALHRTRAGGGARCASGPGRIRRGAGSVRHLGGDSDQHLGRECALVDADEPGA